MRRRSHLIRIFLVVSLTFLFSASGAQENAPGTDRNLDLLDRGAASRENMLARASMNATLAVGLATPGITFMGIGAGTSLMGVGPPAYQGNFYAAPADFPSSWYPFAVTGAFAWGLMLRSLRHGGSRRCPRSFYASRHVGGIRHRDGAFAAVHDRHDLLGNARHSALGAGTTARGRLRSLRRSGSWTPSRRNYHASSRHATTAS